MNDSIIEAGMLTPVPLWRHIFAMLYDALLVIALILITGAGFYALAVPQVLWLCIWIGVPVLFFGTFWRRSGQTLGMQAWRIQLVTDSGDPLSWYQVLIRILGALLAAGPLGAGYLWRYVPPRRRYWHDTLSRTHLVRLPKHVE